MIPYASQRGLGQDLATHLMNEEDNEYMELAQVRGAIAQDLHGAFAEWEAQAHALTKCSNYLYSLSINPDERQRRLTREEYLDYIEAVEKKQGLDGQPRAVVFHIKHDKYGNAREHCHVIWSRTITAQRKAVHLPFDHDKLMMVTREFAHERGLTLPDGYYKDVPGKGRQATLYHQHQQNVTGLSQEERKAVITQAWKRSDSAKALVRALEDKGYMLARGERPYVLVDINGHCNSLPRLIDDPEVRLKNVRAFLEREFPPESLPTVEEAQALAAEYRQMSQAFFKANAKAQELERLKDRQAERRKKTEQEIKQAKDRQAGERRDLHQQQRQERLAFRKNYLAEVGRIRHDRKTRQTRRLSGFLSKITGVSFVRSKVQQYRDRKLYETFIEGKFDLRDKHDAQQRALQHRHHLQTLNLDRKTRALDCIEEHERRSLDKKLVREQRTRRRGNREHMPAFRLELKPRGRPAAPHKAKSRFTSPLREQERKAAAGQTKPTRKLDLSDEFDRAAGEGRSGEGSGSAAGEFKPVAQDKVRRKEARKEAEASKRMEEFNRVSREDGGEESAGSASGDFHPEARKNSESLHRKDDFNRAAGEGQSEQTGTDDASDPTPVPEEKTQRRRRRNRKRDRSASNEARQPDDLNRYEVSQNDPGDKPEGQESVSGKKQRRTRRPRKRDRDRDRGM